MEILIETCLNDLFIALISKREIIDKIHIKNLIQKSDALSDNFDKLIKRNNVKVKDIDTIYVTKGPGSFMGVRAGIIFSSTLASISGIELKTLSTLKFIAKQGKSTIDARGGQFYKLIDDKIKLVENGIATEVDYDFIERNISDIISQFKTVNPISLKPLYVKEPRIG